MLPRKHNIRPASCLSSRPSLPHSSHRAYSNTIRPPTLTPQAKQMPNEFIVLNAGAYHSGYNLGFNCAEAVNFATEEWLTLGRNVKR